MDDASPLAITRITNAHFSRSCPRSFIRWPNHAPAIARAPATAQSRVSHTSAVPPPRAYDTAFSMALNASSLTEALDPSTYTVPTR